MNYFIKREYDFCLFNMIYVVSDDMTMLLNLI